jgi:hypothetical protein
MTLYIAVCIADRIANLRGGCSSKASDTRGRCEYFAAITMREGHMTLGLGGGEERDSELTCRKNLTYCLSRVRRAVDVKALVLMRGE